jgi:predicted nuclease of predicted toxin-antitoxin system
VKFLLDHDVPVEIAHLLRYWEHNVTVLRTVLPVTASDKDVFGHACSQGLMLISCNRDHFLTLAHQTHDHPGLIILIRRRTRHSECAHLSVLLQRAGEKGIRNNVNFA